MADYEGVAEGKRIRFLDEEGELVGTVNGKPLEQDGNVYIPVYVSEGDRCVMVHALNIVERLP